MMSQYVGLTALLCFCTLLTVSCLGVVGHAADSQGFLAQVLHGREVFERNCMECHGADGKGTGQLAAALPVRPADLTDCKLTDEDPVLMGQGIIRHGGPYIGRSSGMPAFGTVLTVSPKKDAAMVNRVGREEGERAGVRFVEADLKKGDGYLKSVRISGEMGLYRQRYCGCRYSFR